MELRNNWVVFCKRKRDHFNNYKRTDTLMDLIDALSSNTGAKSVVELTMSAQFQRSYSALNKAIAIECLDDKRLARLAVRTLPEPNLRKFYLLCWE